MSNSANIRHHVGNRTEKPVEELVRRFYALFDSGRLDEFSDCVHPDFAANVLGTTDLDWDGLRQFGESFRSAFPDGSHKFDHVLAEQDCVVTIGTYDGTHLGNMHGINATGKAISLAVMHIDRVIDGKLIEHRGLANQVDLMGQLGIEITP